jgi:23S rRNA pseudouridine2457 synthase
MARLIRFYKPYGVLSQFRASDARPTLANFIDAAGFYPAGRLDADSEGLLLLTDDGRLQARIAHPKNKLEKTYLVQVLATDGHIAPAALDRLREGVTLRDGPSRASSVRALTEAPDVPERSPPVVPRHAATSAWLSIGMTTGRNRQVRRMLAAVGYPVLRLVRVRIGPWTLDDLRPGQWRMESLHLPADQPRSSRQVSRRR